VALLDRTARRAPSSPDQPDEPDSLPERILRLGLAMALVAVLIQTTAELTNYFVFDMGVWSFDADADDNGFAWASSVAQFAPAFTCLLLALTGWWSTRRLVALSLILAFFSLDDIARFHENLGSAVREHIFGLETGFGRLIWPIVFFPLLAAAFILLWQFGERAGERAGRFVRVGLLMLVLATFAEAGSSVLHVGDADAEGRLPDVLEVSIEEGLELAAWILIASAATAVVAAVLTRQGRPAS